MRHLLPRLQQRLWNQLRSNTFTLDDHDNDNDVDNVDLQIGYRRQEIADQFEDLDQDDLSDHAIIRLAVARARAMERYHEING